MRKLYSIYSICIFMILCSIVPVQAADNMKAFPPSEEGMVRYVLQLPKQDDESLYKVELIVGKIVKVDKRNKYFFGGKIEVETIKGWGFPRYNVTKLGPMVGTIIAIDPNEPKVNKFIKLGGEAFLIRYNSRLPIVVYAREGVEVRYRIWSADHKTKKLEEG
ncbi:MAG: ecotin family protein [Deltaproteobacteria bacterium]|nr:ecotin family protein [Deltaproteobacteria bacterium]